MLSRVARAAVSRRVPAAFAPVSARGYADSFKEKENAQEGHYARQQEAAQLAKMREQIASKRAELEKLEKEHAEASTKK